VLAMLALSACSSGGEAAGGGESPAGTPFPTAANGQDYAACADGNCEVLVRESATLTVEGQKVAVTVADGTVRLTGRHANGSELDLSVSGNGVAGWGSGDRSHELTITAADDSAALLRLTSS